MQHLQLDNMTSAGMPVILAPSKALIDKPDLTRDSLLLKQRSSPFRQQEESKEQDEEGTPFIQFIMTTAEAQRPGETSTTTRIRAIQLAIQEFQFQIESSIIDTNIKFIIELVQVFTNKPGAADSSREAFERAKL